VIGADAQAMDTDGSVEPSTASRKSRRILSCGRPLAETEVRVRASNGDLLPDRRVGEIVIRSASLFSGYNQLPELTARKLVDGWCHTGDLGFLEAGELFVTGRIDDLVIVYGRNYYAHEIEEAANLVEGIAPGRLVAFAVDSAASGTAEVVILAELQPGADPAEARRQIKAAVLDHLGLAVQTVAFLDRGKLAKSTSGKISRDRNKSHYLNGLSEASRAGPVA
jgi:fatty-acyl-CoA synthase